MEIYVCIYIYMCDLQLKMCIDLLNSIWYKIISFIGTLEPFFMSPHQKQREMDKRTGKWLGKDFAPERGLTPELSKSGY